MRRKSKKRSPGDRRQDWAFRILISRRRLSLVVFDHQNRSAVIGMQLTSSSIGIARNRGWGTCPYKQQNATWDVNNGFVKQ
jgi:hypothetical protein